MMRAWLRRNAIALVVVLVAAPALVGVLLGLPLYENAQATLTPLEVDKGEPIDVDGYTWTLVASAEFPSGEENDAIPDGLALVAAIIEVRPGEGAVTTGNCDATLTSRTAGVDREWLPLSSPTSFNYGIGDESTTVCILDGEAFDYEAVFLAPAGTFSEATVDVEIGGMAGTLVRFALTD